MKGFSLWLGSDRVLVAIVVIGFLSLLVSVVTFSLGGSVAEVAGLQMYTGEASLGGAFAGFIVSFYVMYKAYKDRLEKDIGSGIESTLAKLDDAALTAFLRGGPAERLAGRWIVRWYKGDVPSDLDAPKAAENEPWGPEPEQAIDVRTYKSRIMCTGYNRKFKKHYWLEGRVSPQGYITLSYWQQEEEGVADLVGVVFLKDVSTWNETRSVFTQKMVGWWMGYTGFGETQTSGGQVEWTKLG